MSEDALFPGYIPRDEERLILQEADQVSVDGRSRAVLLYGPGGSGKTTLAQIIAEMTHAKFIRISGVESNVAEMRRVIAAATNRLRTSGQKTILFIDEIHHFNKAQQDILLPDVETGNLGNGLGSSLQ